MLSTKQGGKAGKGTRGDVGIPWCYRAGAILHPVLIPWCYRSLAVCLAEPGRGVLTYCEDLVQGLGDCCPPHPTRACGQRHRRQQRDG